MFITMVTIHYVKYYKFNEMQMGMIAANRVLIFWFGNRNSKDGEIEAKHFDIKFENVRFIGIKWRSSKRHFAGSKNHEWNRHIVGATFRKTITPNRFNEINSQEFISIIKKQTAYTKVRKSAQANSYCTSRCFADTIFNNITLNNPADI
jgi:hypothetical protein